MNLKESSSHGFEYYIGIDQSIAHSGICVLKAGHKKEDDFKIEEVFGISTHPSSFFEHRVILIKQKIEEVVDKYKSDIGDNLFVAIEGLAFAPKRGNNITMLYGLFSVILVMLEEKGIPYKVITPLSLKKSYTGYGKSKKPEMLAATSPGVISELSEKSKVKSTIKKFEDIIDAFALASVSHNEQYKV